MRANVTSAAVPNVGDKVAPPVPPITERIAAALASEEARSRAQLEALRDEAGQAYLASQSAEAMARIRSLDAGFTVVAAREARDEADDHLHEMRRIQAAVDRIDGLLPDIKAAEHRAAIMPAYEKFRDERAAFIERLRDRWPKLSAEMVELLNKIERYRQGPAVEIPEGKDPLRRDVEMEARDIAGFSIGHLLIAPLGDATIPAFDPSAGNYVWTRQHKRTSTW